MNHHIVLFYLFSDLSTFKSDIFRVLLKPEGPFETKFPRISNEYDGSPAY